jgi:hypothetical protein
MFNLCDKNSGRYERKLQALTDKLKAVDDNIESLLDTHQISHEQLASFLSNPEHFGNEVWTELQRAEQALEQQLHVDLDHAAKPADVHSRYKELQDAQRWLFVR